MNWISVKTRLPEKHVECLIVLKETTLSVTCGEWDGERWWNGCCDMHHIPITHWAPLPPLPEPPKDE